MSPHYSLVAITFIITDTSQYIITGGSERFNQIFIYGTFKSIFMF